MKNPSVFVPLCIVGLILTTGVARASDDLFSEVIHAPSEQPVGQGHSAIWTMPLVATQYQPLQPTAAMRAALQAQSEDRFLDALILLDEASKSGRVSADTEAEMNLLRASFLLQGNQSRQVIENLAPLLTKAQYAADAHALTAMADLQQGNMQQALEAANQAANHVHDSGGGMLPHLALSYTLQGMGRLEEALKTMHDFNARTPQSPITLAREAELALTLGQTQSARTLVDQAREMDATQPYVIAVSGLVYLINGQAHEARAAFQTALKRDPKDAKALLGLGLSETKLGNSQTGQEKLQAANEADPNDALILTYLGRSQQNLGQTEAARASWRSAQLADPKDPIPWLYQAQAELQANHPLDARESLREAQERLAYRQVYRGERLLKEDEQLLQANLAEVQRQLGLDSLAFQTLSDSVGEKTSSNLRNQAEALQGQRFAESARRSLLLQSLFNERPGNLPEALDIYGDNAWQAGSSTPQHGVVSGLSSEQASYNNYDELFTQRTTLEADATTGSQNTNGEQVRLGVGSDTLGLSLAQRRFKTDGSVPFDYLDNTLWQGVVEWRPTQSTQAFVSHQTFYSQHGEVLYPGSALLLNDAMIDHSQVTRLGLRHSLTDGNELRGLWSSQTSDHSDDYTNYPPPYNLADTEGSAHGEDLQYLSRDATHASQWGVQHTHGRQLSISSSTDYTVDAQQLYAAWQQELNQHWRLDAGLAWGKTDTQDNLKTYGDRSTSLARWLPKLGAVYTPDTVTHLRLAAWQGMGMLTLGDATLAPVTLAGILLPQSGDDGKWIHSIALSGDRQLSSSWLLDARIQRRKTDNPAIDNVTGLQYLIGSQLDTSSLTVHWQAQEHPFAISLTYDYERIHNDAYHNGPLFALDSANEQVLSQQQLNMTWFASARCSTSLKWSHNWAYGTQNVYDQNYNQIFPAYQNSFDQLDADLTWKLNRSGGLLTAGVRNAFDKRFQYADTDPLNPRFSNGRLTYAKVKLAW